MTWVYRRIQRRSITKKLPFGKDRYVTLWKVFDIKSNNKHVNKLTAQFNEYIFTIGKNTAEGNYITTASGGREDVQYTPGFHCLTSKADAEEWEGDCVSSPGIVRKILPVKVRKGWITGIGQQCGLTVIVCKHIIIESGEIS